MFRFTALALAFVSALGLALVPTASASAVDDFAATSSDEGAAPWALGALAIGLLLFVSARRRSVPR
ncbi:MAG TPA: hypothetical protein VL043_16125 [Protaetiibacter sp.]|nr:hypothetical protein [Protaetiibacter sp.]